MRGGQLEHELAARRKPILEPQLAVHRPGQVAGREQPDPGPARRVVAADERLEDPLPPLGRDARPVVGDGEQDASAVAPAVGSRSGRRPGRTWRRSRGDTRGAGRAGRPSRPRGAGAPGTSRPAGGGGGSPRATRRSSRRPRRRRPARASAAPRAGRAGWPGSSRPSSRAGRPGGGPPSPSVAVPSAPASRAAVPMSSRLARTTASGVRSSWVTIGDQARPRLVDRPEAVDLGLGLGLEPALLDDPGQERRERLEEAHVAPPELAPPDGLDVEHADDRVVPDERHRAHRGEARLVEALEPGEARVASDVQARPAVGGSGRPVR